ncbi:putative phage abortive infection protein [Caulobacter zeae]|uniref:putative phage abortive infection protein n=1 Tax=Caulobacter zeae TaxID=2055137 RepID=UPI0013FDB48E|nr:putative phage abortive infection protein [Caulobacter zeae]
MATKESGKPSIFWFLVMLLAVFVAWWGLVALGATGLNIWPGKEWNFERTGQLGDSFGILSAFMTTLAAFFTYRTLVEEREAYRLQQQRDNRLDRIAKASAERLHKRERQQDEAASLSAAEARFFRMLDLRLAILGEMVFYEDGKPLMGRNAINAMFRTVNTSFDINSSIIEKEKLANRFTYVSAHYHRFTYHIIKDLVDGPLQADAYRYARILRAQLSESELAMIAFTCAYGDGRGRFADFAREFAFFHNLSAKTIKDFGLREALGDAAFERASSEGAVPGAEPT